MFDYKYLYITNDLRTFEKIPNEYKQKFDEIKLENIVYTEPNLLETYLSQSCLKRKYWNYDNINYIILNNDCDIIKQEQRKRVLQSKRDCLKKNKYRSFVSVKKYEKKKQDCKNLLSILQNPNTITLQSVSLDKLIEDKVETKLKKIVITKINPNINNPNINNPNININNPNFMLKFN